MKLGTPRYAFILGLGFSAALTYLVLEGNWDIERATFAANSIELKNRETPIPVEDKKGVSLSRDSWRSAHEVLAHNPISPSAIRVLSLADSEFGRQREATDLKSLAATLGWRDGPSQLWLAEAFFQQGDYAHAAERIDAALRISPQSIELYSLLNELILDQNFADVLTARLLLNPQWRDYFLKDVGNLAPGVLEAKASLLRKLAHRGAALAPSETLPVIMKMLQLGQAISARQLWLITIHSSANSVYDPTFRASDAIGARPFGWSILPVLGISASMRSTGSADGGLYVASDGSASGVVAVQIITLTPGPHILTYRVEASATALNAFGWDVRCEGTDTPLIITLAKASEGHVRFTVPPNCSPQYLELRFVSDPLAANADVLFKEIRIE